MINSCLSRLNIYKLERLSSHMQPHGVTVKQASMLAIIDIVCIWAVSTTYNSAHISSLIILVHHK